MNGDERINGAPVSNYEMRDLLDAATMLGLLGTNSTGGLHTWSNGVVWSKCFSSLTCGLLMLILWAQYKRFGATSYRAQHNISFVKNGNS